MSHETRNTIAIVCLAVSVVLHYIAHWLNG